MQSLYRLSCTVVPNYYHANTNQHTNQNKTSTYKHTQPKRIRQPIHKATASKPEKKTQHWDSDHNNRIELNSKYKQNLCESNATKVKGYIPMLEFHLQHNQFAIQGKPKREKHNILTDSRLNSSKKSNRNLTPS